MAKDYPNWKEVTMDMRFDFDQPDETQEPKPDLYHCYYCEADFDITDCDEHEVCDWENGYYTVHSCPSCGDDGGEYTMSEKQAERWWKWNGERQSDIKKPQTPLWVNSGRNRIKL